MVLLVRNHPWIRVPGVVVISGGWIGDSGEQEEVKNSKTTVTPGSRVGMDDKGQSIAIGRTQTNERTTMSNSHTNTTLMTCSILALAAGQAGADCQIDWQPPHKVLFQADLSVESQVALGDSDPQHDHGYYEKNVPAQQNGRIWYEVSKGAGMFEDDVDSDFWAYAYGDMSATVSGWTYDHGFEIALTLDGHTDSYNGSTDIKAETTAYYTFSLDQEVRFGFIAQEWELGPYVQMEAWMTNLQNGASVMMNDLETHEPENNPTLQPGEYQVELRVSTTQSGCEEFLSLGGSMVAEMWFECLEFTPIAGDINKDQIIDGKDLALLVSGFKDYFKDADLNQDEKVDGQDLAILLGNWSK